MEALDRPAWNPQRQCTATSRSGERCLRNAIPGGTICIPHGGGAPQVQQAAKTRLIAMVEPVLATFEEILSSWHRVTCTGCGHVDEHGVKCVGCGKPTGDPMPVIRIGQLVLDRSGFHPTLAIEPVTPPNPYEDFTEDQLIERLETMLDHLRANRTMRAELEAGVVEEGFLVPEEDDAPIDVPEPETLAGDPNPLEFGTPDKGTDGK